MAWPCGHGTGTIPLYTKKPRLIFLLFCRDPPRCLLLRTLGLDDCSGRDLGRRPREPQLFGTLGLDDFSGRDVRRPARGNLC